MVAAVVDEGNRRMRRRLLAAASLLAFAGLAPGLVYAGEQGVALNAQTGVAVTIYNQDLALVRDVRHDDARQQGENDVAFVDVSGHIQPETALLKSAPASSMSWSRISTSTC